MLVAVSGSQGSGKTTVLAELAARGHNTVQRKVARSILDEMGVPLAHVFSDPVITMEFQDKLLQRKIADEQQYVASDKVWLTERSFADLFAYAVIYLGKYNECSDWLNNYHAACEHAQYTYTMVYYLRAGLFDVAHDGIRGANLHYSRLADVAMWDLTASMTPPRSIQINSANLDDRIELITNHINKIITSKGKHNDHQT